MAEKPKRDKLFSFLKNFKADITCLQETHITNETEGTAWAKEWGGDCVWSYGSHRSRGVGILFQPGSAIEIKKFKNDYNGRIASVLVNIADYELNILNVYAPNVPKEREEFMGDLWNYILNDDNLTLCGDFNCVHDPTIDKNTGYTTSGMIGTDDINNILKRSELCDIWRLQHPKDRIFTWHNNDYSLRSRLDRIYIPLYVASSAITHIRACPFSDHAVAEVIFYPDKNRRGKGVWKLNASILKDKLYCEEIICFTQYWKTTLNESAIFEWWDKYKDHVKSISIKHSVRIVKQSRMRETQLLKTLTDLESKSDPNLQAIQNTKEELYEIVTKRLQGVKIRSRAKWTEEGEKPTKYFFDLERKKQINTKITKLNNGQNTVKNDRSILEEIQKYYQTLYTREETDKVEQDSILDLLENKLTDRERELCEGPVSEPELLEALKSTQINKSPGHDGIIMEFYKQFWLYLKDILVKLYNYAFGSKALSVSQNHALIRLLFKKGLRELLKNWRPISLLNTDYKLLTTLLARRLKTVLPIVIGKDQTCGIMGRRIFDNVFRLRDLCFHAMERQGNLILINLDQEKAFDRVDRFFLDRILQKMNFGPSFRQWLQTIYHLPVATVINNGHESGTITLERGLRQGCPLSPLLYTIVIETLCVSIRKNRRIEGFFVPGLKTESKISAYADDITLTLRDDCSVTSAFDMIRQYELASGAKLNMEKSEGIYVGLQAGRNHGPVPIRWLEEQTTILGINFGNSLTQNWEKCIKKIENGVAKWQKRKLTLKGKSVIINTYAVSHLVYLASVFEIPPWVIRKVNKLIFGFLWNNKNERVSRKTCHLPFDKGGLGIADLSVITQTALTKWISLITTQNDDVPMWVFMARYWTGLSLSNLRDDWKWLRSTLMPHGNMCNIPPWYEVLLNILKQHNQEIGKLGTDITQKKLKLILQVYQPPKAEQRWMGMCSPQPVFSTTWKELWSLKSENRTKEIIWLLIHNALPTKDVLYKRGITTNNRCPVCRETETMVHVFVTCRAARRVWEHMKRWIDQIAGERILVNLSTIAFGIKVPDRSHQRELCLLIIRLIATKIWETRNKNVLRGTKNDNEVIGKVFKTLRRYITEDYMVSENRLSFWAYLNVLCSQKDDGIHFNF